MGNLVTKCTCMYCNYICTYNINGSTYTFKILKDYYNKIICVYIHVYFVKLHQDLA